MYFYMSLIRYHYETCAGISLPVNHPDKSLILEQEKEEIMLECMATMVVLLPKSVFGIDESSLSDKEKCFLPYYQTISTFCPVLISPMDMQKENEVDLYDPTKNEIYLNKFCSLAIDISSLKGRECTLPLCEALTDLEAEDIHTSGLELKAVVKVLSNVIKESLLNQSVVKLLSIAGIPVHGIQVSMFLMELKLTY